MVAPSLLWFLALALLAAPIGTALAAPSSSPIEWQGGIEIARGRGERGPWQQSRSRFDYVDDPAVVIDDSGQIAVAWVDQRRKAVLFQRYAANGTKQLARPVDLSRHPETFSWLPRLAAAPDAPAKIFVLWQEIIFSGGSHGGDILFARSDNGGRSFAEPINLSRSRGGDGKGRINKEIWHNGSLDLVAGPNGALYAAWTEYDGPLWLSRSHDGGRSFSRPAQVAAHAGAHPARAPSLALGPDGALYLAWTVGDNDAADIHVAKSTDGGRSFGSPQQVAPSKSYSDAPKLAVDSTGVVHLVYAESSGGPFALYHVRYTRSTDGTRTFEPPRDISQPMPDAFAGASFPSLSIDAQGRLYVLWELYQDARQPPRGLALSVSHDGGSTFTHPVVVPGSADAGGGFNGSSQGMLMKKLAVNGSGAVAVVNSSLKPGAHSRVWLMRGRVAR
ncbi:MAG TPA: sialidase family protein [Ramlibacter sp.]|nr:sialidase family protein [Ramlibacter sp.]